MDTWLLSSKTTPLGIKRNNVVFTLNPHSINLTMTHHVHLVKPAKTKELVCELFVTGSWVVGIKKDVFGVGLCLGF